MTAVERAKAALAKFNPHHDDRGRFADSDGSGSKTKTFSVGHTGTIPHDTPTDGELRRLGTSLRVAAANGGAVSSFSSHASVGEFMGDKERTLDFRMNTTPGYNARSMMSKLSAQSDREGQQASFLSRKLGRNEPVDLSRNRPGVEIALKPTTMERVQPLIDHINSRFPYNGMTLETDGKRVTGIRIQHIPEFGVGNGYDGKMSDDQIKSSIRDARNTMRDIADDVRSQPGVTNAQPQWYETQVHFFGERDPVGGAWRGQSVHDGIAAAEDFSAHQTGALDARRLELVKERSISRGLGRSVAT